MHDMRATKWDGSSGMIAVDELVHAVKSKEQLDHATESAMVASCPRSLADKIMSGCYMLQTTTCKKNASSRLKLVLN